MPRFDRYMLSQLMVLFGFFSLVLISIYWVNRAVALFEQLLGDGESAMVFLEFAALTLPNVIRVVLPISTFAAAVYVTNRLSTESELVVMQATGFSPFRLARPVLVFGLIVAAILFALVHFLVPASRAQLAMRGAELAQNATSAFLSEGRFMHPTDGITFYIREITPQGALDGIFLSDTRSASSQTIYTAQRALLVRSEGGPKLIMLDGTAQTLDPKQMRLAVTRFEDLTYDLGAMFDTQRTFRPDVRQMPTHMLFNPSEEAMANARADRAAFLHEAHSRIALPLLAPVAALIGFSTLLLGAFSRFGVWRQVVVAMVLLIFIQMLDNATTGIALSDARFWPITYLPVVIGALLVYGMLWHAGAPRKRRKQRMAGAAA